MDIESQQTMDSKRDLAFNRGEVTSASRGKRNGGGKDTSMDERS